MLGFKFIASHMWSHISSHPWVILADVTAINISSVLCGWLINYVFRPNLYSEFQACDLVLRLNMTKRNQLFLQSFLASDNNKFPTARANNLLSLHCLPSFTSFIRVSGKSHQFYKYSFSICLPPWPHPNHHHFLPELLQYFKPIFSVSTYNILEIDLR